MPTTRTHERLVGLFASIALVALALAGCVENEKREPPPTDFDALSCSDFANGNQCVDGQTVCMPEDEPSLAETVESSCSDGFDNDCDGLADCDDPDCDLAACAENGFTCSVGVCSCSAEGDEGATVQDCQDGSDNDCDGLTDGADDNCIGRPCDSTGARWSDQGECSCFADQVEETSCEDGFDNDCNGLADCQDPSCDLSTCVDPALAPNNIELQCIASNATCGCPGDPEGSHIEAACDDNQDNDCDGFVDCADLANCNNKVCGLNGKSCDAGACTCPGGAVEAICGDGLDNDCDGLVDCQDDDCDNITCEGNGLVCMTGQCACPGLQQNESTCGDTLDNDCDGLNDCIDPDCATLVCGTGKLCELASTSCVVDPGTDRLEFSANKARVLATSTATVTLTAHVSDNTGNRAGVDVTFYVDKGGIDEAFGASTLTVATDAAGLATATWRTGELPGKDVEARADIAPPSATAAVSKTLLVQIVGLSSINVANVQFDKMGVQTSGYQESNIISFRLTGSDSVSTNLVPPDGILVTFDSGAETSVTLRPTSATAINGLVSLTVDSGRIATNFSIRASTTVGIVSDEVVTPSIAIVGAKPTHRGMTFSCAKKSTPALVDTDGIGSLVMSDINCTVTLQDRFTNPIGIPTPVSYQTEGGVVDSPINTSPSGTSIGTSKTVFHTFGPLPTDVPPLTGEIRWTDLSNKIHNQRDGWVSIIAFTNGEEEFVDNNQNGLYDAGEVFVDLAEPFVDVNDNSTRDAGEPFTDVNGNSQWDGPNNQWDSNRLIWTETRIVEVACGVGDKATFDGGEKAGFRLISGSTNPIPDADLQLPDSVLELYVSDYNGNVIYGGTKVDLSKIGTGTLSFMYTDGTKSHTARDTYYIPWTLRHQCASGPPCNCAVEICTVESTIGPFAVPLVDSVFVGDATGGDTDPPETAGVRAVYSGISACPPGVYTYDLSVD
ncbi:MAG: hypothetical protein CO108_11050 [Deltaproteobacteria bacterium CG_4_9_14_3_um_filter_63_12]|nr:MAG: hypothetical protein CO108_11050 [Deltaproteobacteria bacterium CG_4_9_14_3_um_filter_63_12]